MAPRVPNARVPSTRSLLPSGAARASKYVPKAENSEFSITRITPQNALNLVKKFSDKELEAQYSPAEIEHLHDLASDALRNEIIGITGRDSNGNIANFNEKSIEWVLQNESLIDRLIESKSNNVEYKSNNAKSLGAFCNYKLNELQTVNNKLFENYVAKSNMQQNDGFLVFNPVTGKVTSGTGAITNPPDTLLKADKSTMPKSSSELNAGDKPIFLIRGKEAPPKEEVIVKPETSAAENSAASPSPEAIGEAMRDAVSKDGTVTVPPEAVAEEVAKEKANPKAVTDGTEVKTAEAATDKAETPPEKGALTGKVEEKPAEPSKGVLSKTWDFLRNHKGKILGWGLGTSVPLGLAGAAIYDLASDDSTLKSLFKGDYPTEIPNISSTRQPRVKSLDQREGAYMPERLLRFTTNEEYTPGKIPSHIPQDRLDDKESSDTIESKSQPQVVKAPAPVNNATADYVRAAYNSYIPSDAGRAYQKAIYGDPLELDRMRLQQQQQQKWRDFVMRSGQSPAELVQRGLMPYDALQYV